MWNRLKAIAEWYLGVAPSGSGESARWSLEFGAADGLTPWIVASIAVAAAIICLLAARDPERNARRRGRLLALRLAALAIIGVWLGLLTLVVVRTGLPTLVLLIDTSASMSLEDQPVDPVRAKPNKDSHAVAESRGRTRLAIGQQLLLDNDHALIRELARRYRLHVYEFSDTARQVGHTTTDTDLATTLQSIAGLTPAGEETRPGPCLDQVLAEFRGAAPAAALVLSDGIPSLGNGEKLSAAQQPAALKVPVYTIALGSSTPALDLEIYDLQVDPIVFVGDTAAVEVMARGFGLAGKEVNFVLQQEGEPNLLAHTSATLSDDGTPVPVRLPLTPTEEGDFELTITARPVEGEINQENNVLRRRVQVRRDQIRVLLVERAPRWEYRHLKALLERDTNVELRTVLQESDLEHQQEDRTALTGFPATRDDLFAYDVLILGDVDLQYLNPGALELVREFVGTRGGGLILIAGERHNPQAFRGTPLEALIPVELADIRRPSAPTVFAVVPARAGSDHPLLRLGDDSRKPEFWERLPALHWSLETRIREPAGLAVASSSTPEHASPVIALQRYGDGQVLFHATDELWRWRMRVEDRYYGRYWRQAVRYLCRAQRLRGAGNSELTTDRTVYRQGDSVRFRLRQFEAAASQVDHEPLTVLVDRRNGKQLSIPLAPAADAPGEFLGSLSSATAGEYHAWLAAPAAADAAPSCDFTVELPRQEMLRQAAEIRDLERAAAASGGTAVALAEVSELPDRLPRGETASVLSSESVALWTRGELLAIFVALLAAEWLLRRGL
jgi:uncharacterized membrane protein